MSGICSFDLNAKQVQDIVDILEEQFSGSLERQKNIEDLLGRMKKWIVHRDRKLKIIDLVKKWLTAYVEKNNWFKDDDDPRPLKYRMDNWVYHQLEYSPYNWDEEAKKVVVSKYCSGPLFSQETIDEILEYLNKEITS